MTLPHVGRMMFHHAGDAAWNMAVDQAIAESASDTGPRPKASGGESGYTLRFYTWGEPTLSLGYFQPNGEASPRFDRLARVRRSTGGGAIVHHHELTYSLTVATSPGEHGARTDLYRGVHAAVVSQLRGYGIDARPYYLTQHMDKRPSPAESAFLCFQRRTDEDLIVSGYKVLGSAQRRVKGAILQHGSLLLRASEHADELPGIMELTSICLNPRKLAMQISAQLGQSLGVCFEERPVTSIEQTRADEIARQRFRASDWWRRR